MKKSTEYTLVILTLIVCLLIFAGGFLYIRLKLEPFQEVPICYPSKTELRLVINNYLKNHRYSEALDYLKNLTKTEDTELLGLISYYLAKVKYERLNYLASQSKWDNFHKYKEIYLSDILKHTEVILTNLPKTEYTIEAYFLRYWVYRLKGIDVKKKEVFEAFKDELNNYCKDNKEYTIIKEYALRLYKNNRIQKAKQLTNMYLKYLKEYLPQDDFEYKLKTYADSVFAQGNYYSARDIYKEYLKTEQDKISAQLALKGIINQYLNKKEYARAEEFAQLAVNKYSKGIYSDYFQLKLAHCYFEMGKEEKAKEIYYKLLEEYPCSPYREEALEQLADVIMIYSFRDREAAVKELKQLNKYTNSKELKAIFLGKIADVYFLDEQYQKALNVYNALLNEYPNTNLILDAQNQIEKCKQRLKN